MNGFDFAPRQKVCPEKAVWCYQPDRRQDAPSLVRWKLAATVAAAILAASERGFQPRIDAFSISRISIFLQTTRARPASCVTHQNPGHFGIYSAQITRQKSYNVRKIE
ncbi:MAG: hypothetical protein WBW41_14755 [Verrucomicrobiia bacterium]